MSQYSKSKRPRTWENVSCPHDMQSQLLQDTIQPEAGVDIKGVDIKRVAIMDTNGSFTTIVVSGTSPVTWVSRDGLVLTLENFDKWYSEWQASEVPLGKFLTDGARAIGEKRALDLNRVLNDPKGWDNYDSSEEEEGEEVVTNDTDRSAK